MRYTLKDYQFAAANEITRALRRAGKDFEDDPNDFWSVALSAPTGAGKTVIASAVIETLFDGGGKFAADLSATVLWVTDDPALNVQTKRNMNQASSTLEEYADLTATPQRAHPASVFPDLGHHQDNALEIALERGMITLTRPP